MTSAFSSPLHDCAECSSLRPLPVRPAGRRRRAPRLTPCGGRSPRSARRSATGGATWCGAEHDQIGVGLLGRLHDRVADRPGADRSALDHDALVDTESDRLLERGRSPFLLVLELRVERLVERHEDDVQRHDRCATLLRELDRGRDHLLADLAELHRHEDLRAERTRSSLPPPRRRGPITIMTRQGASRGSSDLGRKRSLEAAPRLDRRADDDELRAVVSGDLGQLAPERAGAGADEARPSCRRHAPSRSPRRVRATLSAPRAPARNGHRAATHAVRGSARRGDPGRRARRRAGRRGRAHAPSRRGRAEARRCCGSRSRRSTRGAARPGAMPRRSGRG